MNTRTVRAAVIPYTGNDDGITLLLIGYSKWNHWSDFGGHQEKSEDAYQCAIRELREEILPPLLVKETRALHGENQKEENRKGEIDGLVRQVTENIKDPQKTYALEAGGERGSINRRYVFFVYVDVDVSIIDSFIPTEETRSIHWFIEDQLVKTDPKELSGAMKELVRFLKKS